ncbi:hypothetical protein THAOC_28322 [Thalassiosira oceanica]|uniref:Uncharacterized protein n=1 Tax=Thalassiosira oceanica TaxID=159749 RepID=K0RJE1_THAOC|nr:hypothetical protein THAOC_28322 [Thalassiosira oceanica]|eukprot:EJK52404.1 hypothetical protein THAOC_28322 [Thalassiosira oceanica]
MTDDEGGDAKGRLIRVATTRTRAPGRRQLPNITTLPGPGRVVRCPSRLHVAGALRQRRLALPQLALVRAVRAAAGTTYNVQKADFREKTGSGLAKQSVETRTSPRSDYMRMKIMVMTALSTLSDQLTSEMLSAKDWSETDPFKICTARNTLLGIRLMTQFFVHNPHLTQVSLCENALGPDDINLLTGAIKERGEKVKTIRSFEYRCSAVGGHSQEYLH